MRRYAVSPFTAAASHCALSDPGLQPESRPRLDGDPVEPRLLWSILAGPGRGYLAGVCLSSQGVPCLSIAHMTCTR
jgi:hypothetical protein